MTQKSTGPAPRIILPLERYDDEGRIRPPRWLWWTLVFLNRGYLLLVASVSYIKDQSLILSLFYPDNRDFYLSLMVGLPALLAAVIAGYRRWLWQKQWLGLFAFIRPLVLISLFLDISLQLAMAAGEQFRFSWTVAIFLLLDGLLLTYWARSRSLKLTLADWRRRD
ncbi:Inner membrane protein YfeZ [Saliniradius amylolyticus]|uniref:Inner membrane protein YfeZ n=1 Tax=Saliniradius amylolyticus TaxID=2183582 RepID=A0A2S2E3K0_9ALTE|nr:DUF2919 family protein [Saliniradius amylolyticus]AWL12213.1 Inner membrane protein YfeZ [Saliniradius amylolyticus]